MSSQLGGSQTFDRSQETYLATGTPESNASVSDTSDSSSPHYRQPAAPLARTPGPIKPQGLRNASERTKSTDNKLLIQSQASGLDCFAPLAPSSSDACDTATSPTGSSKELQTDDTKILEGAVHENFLSGLPILIPGFDFSNHQEHSTPIGNGTQGDFGVVSEQGKFNLGSSLSTTLRYIGHIPEAPANLSFEHPFSWLTRFQQRLLYFFPPEWACFVHHIIVRSIRPAIV